MEHWLFVYLVLGIWSLGAMAGAAVVGAGLLLEERERRRAWKWVRVRKTRDLFGRRSIA